MVSPNSSPSEKALPSPTRKQAKAATRAGIKEAALSVFRGAGYAGANVGDIARRADVAHGTFYVHFPNKDALLDELVDDFNGRFVEKLRPVLDELGRVDVETTVRRTAEAFIDTWNDERAFVACVAERGAAGFGRWGLRDGVNQPMLELLKTALPALLGERVGEVELELTIHALLAMWLRIGLRFLFCEAVTRAQAIDTLVPITLGALGGLRPARSAGTPTKKAKTP